MALMLREQADLSGFNSFGIVARARELITLAETADAPAALERLSRASRQLLLGGGSNILFSDDFEGCVLRVALRGRRLLDDRSDAQTCLVEAAAGEPWHDFVQWTLAQGLFGLENLSLIPGTVGAGPVQNIGAYGVEIRDSLHSVDALAVADGQPRTFTADECGFGYRDSIFRQSAQAGVRSTGRSDWLLTRVRFRLSRTPRPRLDYADLREALAREGIRDPQPDQIAQAVCAIRRRKLPDPAVLGNAGSFFRNPVIARHQADTLVARWPQIPLRAEPGSPERFKLPAAWLIEQCGWKGRRLGDAGVAAQHALVLVNHGMASGRDLLALARAIQASVEERFGITLTPEVVIV